MTKIVIVLPADASAEQEKLFKNILDVTGRLGLDVLKAIRIERHRVMSGPERDRLFPLIKINDARWLYAEIHRYDVAVLTLSAAYVRRDPSRTPARLRQLLPLERFVRYKAYYGLVRTVRDIDVHCERLKNVFGRVECDGVDDPRILPLHIFNCGTDWKNLGDPDGQREFADEHGPSSRRRDCAGAYWEKPKGQAARHGGPALRVGRAVLPSGFHWDVSTAEQLTIHSPDAVWKLKGRNAYLNIYPDGYIRVPKRNSGAIKVWPKENKK